MRKIGLIIVALILLAGLAGWLIGRSGDDSNANQSNTSAPANSAAPVASTNTTSGDVKSLVSYSLPGGWKEDSCPGKNDVFITPPNTSMNCNTEVQAPIAISSDSSNATDCNQLQNVQNVSKHICISEYINGHKSLKAETVYGKDSPYKKDTAINAYYIDTGKGVVKLLYIHDPSDTQYLSGFEQLAKSIQVKG